MSVVFAPLSTGALHALEPHGPNPTDTIFHIIYNTYINSCMPLSRHSYDACNIIEGAELLPLPPGGAVGLGEEVEVASPPATDEVEELTMTG